LKKILCLILAAVMLFAFGACEGDNKNGTEGITVTDFAGNTAYLTEDSRVVSCYASLSGCWTLAGGELVGVTDDCSERGMIFENSPEIIGSTKIIDMEKLISLEPDYVILSYDLTPQRELEDMLRSMKIPYGYFREDTFDDYKNIMRQFTSVSGRSDLYEENVTETEARINNILSAIPTENDGTYLLLRAYSTGMKVKRDDNLAGLILDEMHLSNIADIVPSLMEELSIEKIIMEDPDHIFITTMGDENVAKEYVEDNIYSSDAWKGLSAVKEGKVHILPQELFHYKPNEKWDMSYEYIAKIIYPEVFTD